LHENTESRRLRADSLNASLLGMAISGGKDYQSRRTKRLKPYKEVQA
jgi:hypothetical protein